MAQVFGQAAGGFAGLEADSVQGQASERGVLGCRFKYTHLPNHWFRCIGLCALAVLAATWQAIAAEPAEPKGNYVRHTFTTDDGLHSNVVNDVLQTQDGFLIVGSGKACFASMDTALPR